MKTFRASGIKYDTDNEDVELQTELIVDCDSEEQVVDMISDITGFCVESVETIEEVKRVTEFGVLVEYSSGTIRTEYHSCKSKKLFWKWFDKHHNKKKIVSAYVWYQSDYYEEINFEDKYVRYYRRHIC